MRPALSLLLFLFGWCLIGIAASFWPHYQPIWFGTGGAIFLVAGIDALLLMLRRSPECEREMPSRFALGVESEVTLVLRNSGTTALRADIFDGLPPTAECGQLPWHGILPPRKSVRVSYDTRFFRRGEVDFAPCHALLHSPLGFWRRRRFLGTGTTIRVFPNYEPIVRFALLSMENRDSPMGIRYRNKAGMSREFHQLRDYKEGDVLSQIDWKATARRRTLISREYQEQRDQTIILLVDSGRRMRALDGEVSQFDHCLNAMLLLSYIALRQGDHVGVQSFGGSDRWMPPVKGQHSMSRILNHLYDYETTSAPSDFAEAAERLMIRQKRRALVVVLTNLRSEDSAVLTPSVRLLQRRHVVMVASLRERDLSERVKTEARGLDQALGVAATFGYFEEREKLMDELRAHGIHMVDSLADALPVAITNEYLRIKQAGLL